MQTYSVDNFGRTELQLRAIGLQSNQDWLEMDSLIDTKSKKYLNNLDNFNKNLLISLLNCVYKLIPIANKVIKKLINITDNVDTVDAYGNTIFYYAILSKCDYSVLNLIISKIKILPSLYLTNNSYFYVNDTYKKYFISKKYNIKNMILKEKNYRLDQKKLFIIIYCLDNNKKYTYKNELTDIYDFLYKYSSLYKNIVTYLKN